MFLMGMVLGMMIGVLLIKLHDLLNSMDDSAKQLKEDAIDTYHYWTEKRKSRN